MDVAVGGRRFVSPPVLSFGGITLLWRIICVENSETATRTRTRNGRQMTSILTL